MPTLYSAIALFAVAALLGMYLISFVLQGRETSKAIAFIHGPVAAIALILLFVYAACNNPAPWASITLFTIAALGGFVLIFKDLTGKPLPKWLAVVHGTAAVVGFVLLLVFTFSS
jgi:hypothetical protein